MVGQRARLRRNGRWSDATASAVVAALTACCVVAVIVTAPADRVNALTIILGIAAVAAGLLVAGETDGLSVSASFLVYVLAGAFLGVRSAATVAVVSELVASLRLHTRVRATVLNNLPANVVPAVVAALICRGIAPAPASTPSFYVSVAVAAVAAITLSFVIFATLRRTFFPTFEQFGVRTLVEYLPNALLNVLLVVAGAEHHRQAR